MSRVITLPLPEDVARALARLTSLHDGDLGVVEITSCGSRAVPALRALLLEGESSGIYQPRCRAVEALAALGAEDVLIEFLRAPREITDPIDRGGEEAVVNAAARALIGSEDERVFPLLLVLAQGRGALAGVVEALGSFCRPEAVPALVRALAEDHTRPAAETMLLRLGSEARPALVETATTPPPWSEEESVSSRRTRLSALRLLSQIGAPGSVFRGLTGDADPDVAAAACCAHLAAADVEGRHDALRQLAELLPRLSWRTLDDAKEFLAEHVSKPYEPLGEDGQQRQFDTHDPDRQVGDRRRRSSPLTAAAQPAADDS